MSDRIKKYIVFSASIFCIILCIGFCYLFRDYWYCIIFWAYLFGIINGLLIIVVGDIDE